jgi:hypothetical protein
VIATRVAHSCEDGPRSGNPSIRSGGRADAARRTAQGRVRGFDHHARRRGRDPGSGRADSDRRFPAGRAPDGPSATADTRLSPVRPYRSRPLTPGPAPRTEHHPPRGARQVPRDSLSAPNTPPTHSAPQRPTLPCSRFTASSATVPHAGPRRPAHHRPASRPRPQCHAELRSAPHTTQQTPHHIAPRTPLATEHTPHRPAPRTHHQPPAEPPVPRRNPHSPAPRPRSAAPGVGRGRRPVKPVLRIRHGK